MEVHGGTRFRLTPPGTGARSSGAFSPAGNQLLLTLANNPIRWLLFVSVTRRLTLPPSAGIAAPPPRPAFPCPKPQPVLCVSNSRLQNATDAVGGRLLEIAKAGYCSGAVRGPRPG